MIDYGMVALLVFVWILGTIYIQGDLRDIPVFKLLLAVVLLFLAAIVWPLIGVWMLWETISSLRERKKIEEGIDNGQKVRTNRRN